MNWHDAANIFPLDEEHIDELAEDINENGLLIPIEILDGKIIDGRRRSMACQRVGIDPDIIEVDPEDPVAYVVSLNLHRRHLTPSQLGMIGGRVKDIYAKQAKERMKAGGEAAGRGRPQQGRGNFPYPIENAGRARDAAGKAVGVSGKLIDRAVDVLTKGVPELAAAVDAGKMSVTSAAEVAREYADRPEVQKEIAEKAKFSSGRDDYLAVKEYQERTGIPLQHCIALVAGETSQSGNQTERFKSGRYTASDDDLHRELLADVLDHCQRCGIPFAKKTLFVQAVSRCLRAPQFDVETFKSRVASNPGLLSKQPTLDATMAGIETVYNYKAGAASRLAVKFVVDEAMRKRSVSYRRTDSKNP